MKKQSHFFPLPVQVIQICRKQARYGKEEKRTFSLKEFQAMESLSSAAGFIEKEELFLDGSVLEKSTEVERFDLIVIIDNILSTKPSEIHFLRTSGAHQIEIFKIRNNDPLELHLEWSYFGVGDPSRENMKLCDLVPSKAYEIRINGKTDFSLTGRRPRHYLEQVFVVEHLGFFSEYRLFSDSEKLFLKELPSTRRFIDLRKPLW